MTIIVCPLHDVEAVARVRRPSHILSLISPNTETTGFQRLDAHHLELRFHDITEPRDGLTAPSVDHLRDLLDFADAARKTGPMLIHCWAGVSRSTAAAFIIACQRSAAGQEPQLALRLRDIAPYATPNIHMVRIADALLCRSGHMVSAALAIRRGNETAWGSAFEMKENFKNRF